MKAQNPRLAALCAAAGITRQELASSAGITTPTLWRISVGICKPSASVAAAIAAALRADSRELFPEISAGHRLTIRARAARQAAKAAEVAR